MDPFVGQIMMVAFNFAPRGWALCNGQLLPISQNTALFSLLGTFYGGDGRTNFALPNLQGRVPVHQGGGVGTSNYAMGAIGGVGISAHLLRNGERGRGGSLRALVVPAAIRGLRHRQGIL